MNERYNMLRSKVDILTQSNHDQHSHLENNYIHISDKMADTRRTQVGSGDRSQRIRTYNFPQNRVTDHRINLTLYRLDAVMEGDLNELVDTVFFNFNSVCEF